MRRELLGALVTARQKKQPVVLVQRVNMFCLAEAIQESFHGEVLEHLVKRAVSLSGNVQQTLVHRRRYIFCKVRLFTVLPQGTDA